MQMLQPMKQVAAHAKHLAVWALIAVGTGALCGAVGTAFHMAVDWATELRTAHGWLLYLLPLAGIVIAALYHALKVDGVGTNHIVRSIRSGSPIPTLLVPVIFIATALTHLFGGSAGREGAALQIGGGLGWRVGQALRLDKQDMRTVTLCGMAAVFSALFATPVTAAVFVLEVSAVGLLQYSALVPCLLSSVTAYGVALLCGLSGSGYAPVVQAIDGCVLGGTAVLAVIVALMSIIECVTLHRTEHLAAKIRNRYLRAAVGGAILIALTLIANTRDYNGAGGEVIARALNGQSASLAFLWKLVFTAVTIGFGFKGGEIVPTFFMGAALGCVIGPLLGLPAELAAALGMVGLFCGVVNCPIASIFLSIELFGSGALPYFALMCGMTYMLSGHFSLYEGAQRIVFSKEKWEEETDSSRVG